MNNMPLITDRLVSIQSVAHKHTISQFNALSFCQSSLFPPSAANTSWIDIEGWFERISCTILERITWACNMIFAQRTEAREVRASAPYLIIYPGGIDLLLTNRPGPPRPMACVLEPVLSVVTPETQAILNVVILDSVWMFTLDLASFISVDFALKQKWVVSIWLPVDTDERPGYPEKLRC